GEKVEKVAAGKRLVSAPLAALTPENEMAPQMRAMMQAMNPDEPLPPVKVELEINPRHPLIHQLSEARESNPELAKLVSEQLLDHALLSADLLEDRVALVNRGFQLLEEALKK
ncbi:MAG: molecular chaperone HtpG, partial [Verrucomicrobiota bacterium]